MSSCNVIVEFWTSVMAAGDLVKAPYTSHVKTRIASSLWQDLIECREQSSSSKRQRKTKGTGHGRRKQVKEPEPEPEPEPKHESDEVQHAPQQEEQHHETEGEKKFELLSDVPQEHFEQEQETLLHHEDLPTATEGETADVTLLIHEDADGHLPQEASPLLKDKEEVAESDPVPVTEAPEGLAFPFEQEQVEHQYYTPLL